MYHKRMCEHDNFLINAWCEVYIYSTWLNSTTCLLRYTTTIGIIHH